jgi:hypothetical protein
MPRVKMQRIITCCALKGFLILLGCGQRIYRNRSVINFWWIYQNLKKRGKRKKINSDVFLLRNHLQRLTKTDLWLRHGSLESSSDTGINTLLLSPGRTTNAEKLLVLMSLEGLGSLLNTVSLVDGSDVHHFSLLFY